MEKRIVEINGAKIEVDLRTATTVETYRVGDPVRVLMKQYGDEYKIVPGFIIGFYPFQNLPSIAVAYCEGETWGSTPSIKFAYINEKTKVEIAPMAEAEVPGMLKNSLELFDNAIDKARRELQTIEAQRDYFQRRMGERLA